MSFQWYSVLAHEVPSTYLSFIGMLSNENAAKILLIIFLQLYMVEDTQIITDDMFVFEVSRQFNFISITGFQKHTFLIPLLKAISWYGFRIVHNKI